MPTMRGWVTLLYALGALLTTLGVVVAFLLAKRELRVLDDIQAVHDRHEDPDPVKLFDLASAGEDDALEAKRAALAIEHDELKDLLRDARLSVDGSLMKDLRLPMNYWAKHSALKDAVASFKVGGLISLVGLALTTVASVWSLYLPPE